MSIHSTIVGRLGKDAKTRDAGRSTVTNFSIATTHGYGDKEQTLWVDCSFWGERGAKLADHLTKGKVVLVQGPLSTREYEGKTYLQLEVRTFEFVPGPPKDRNTHGDGYADPNGSRNNGGGYGNYGGYGNNSGGGGGYGGGQASDDVPF